MNISAEELRERYAGLNTDELLNIKVSSDLQEEAKKLLDAELNIRKVDETDYKEAKEIHEYLENEREEVKRNIQHRLRRLLILWGIVFVCFFVFMALWYSWHDHV